MIITKNKDSKNKEFGSLQSSVSSWPRVNPLPPSCVQLSSPPPMSKPLFLNKSIYDLGKVNNTSDAVGATPGTCQLNIIMLAGQVSGSSAAG